MVREDGVYKTEVHVAGICIRHGNDGDGFEVLAGKRTPERELFPNRWECGGGQLHRGEDFETALKRQMEQEFAIGVTPKNPVKAYDIRTEETVIPGLRFICTPSNGDYTVEIDDREFVDYEWIPENRLGDYDFIPGLRTDVLESIAIYHSCFERLEGRVDSPTS